MRKTLLLMSVSLLLLSAQPSGAAEMQVITVALVSPSWNTGLPTAVARGAGFFKNEGLEVRPVTLASSRPIMMALLMSGQAEMVIAGGVAILRGIARGAPVVVVGGHLSRMSYALIGAKGLKTVEDLKGKAIGITGIGGIGEFAVVESLKRNGLVKDRDFSLLISKAARRREWPSEGRQVQSVLVRPAAGQAEKDGFTILLDVRESLADLPSNIVASTREFAKSNPDKTTRFLRALARAMDLIRQDKDKAITLGRANGLRGDAAIERKALDYYVQDLDIGINKNNVESLLRMPRYFRSSGKIL